MQSPEWVGGCRQELTFRWDPKACANPSVIVDFPSPIGVGVILQVEGSNITDEMQYKY